jgi:hypothetical protein
MKFDYLKALALGALHAHLPLNRVNVDRWGLALVIRGQMRAGIGVEAEDQNPFIRRKFMSKIEIFALYFAGGFYRCGLFTPPLNRSTPNAGAR